MGRDIRDLLGGNKIALQQFDTILETATADKEYSRLSLAMKNGRPTSCKTACDALIPVIKGISDVSHKVAKIFKP
jgi:hypothetical protein